jgi:cation diffusion facilitator family transporter
MQSEDRVGIEKHAILTSVVGALVVACNGLVFGMVTGAQAILLDGFFNLTAVATGLFTLRVATLLRRGDDEQFPVGYTFFEPLVNGIKGLLLLGVTLIALVGAVKALFTGGRAITLGWAVVYGVFATLTCWAVALLIRRSAKRSNSPLVQADAESWIVNAAISSAVLVTLLIVFLIRDTSLRFMVNYVDPLLVCIIGGVSLGVPIRLAWKALMGLLNRTPSLELLAAVRKTVDDALADLPVKQVTVRVIQPGRTRIISAHILLEPEFSDSLAQLDDVRGNVAAILRADYPDSQVDLLFTQDPRCSAPLGGL